ncbi:MAG: DNA-3-methyladenine glycosylase [Melioribacteraceae bacterium]|nr:DNA-3-methyladenine glycosylase [Melioribacteraceae bacterium]MCF8432309.1 DNA-3-methyladenine glycosylase [Melioribacteraceae bacterium]
MIDDQNLNKLPQSFYARDLLEIAPEILGKIFVKKSGSKIFSGSIVEVEAYHGAFDEAAHTFRGKTKANEIMFDEGGKLYVYFIYGMYFCCNIVTGKKDEGSAILIRGIEPISGTKCMMVNRSKSELKNLTNGPGKICQAFGITKSDNGTDLLGDDMYLLDTPTVSSDNIVQTTRIGISKSKDLPWRFYIKNNPFVSKP